VGEERAREREGEEERSVVECGRVV